MRKIYLGLTALLMLALPFAASAADSRNGITTVNSGGAQVNEAAAKEATMERLERQEDGQTAGEYIDDAGITAKVKAKFVGQKGLDSLDIKVVTVDGNVTLMGDVDDSAQINLAERTAMAVEGVHKVENKLTLKQ